MFSVDGVECCIGFILSLQLYILNNVAGSGLTDLVLDPHRGIATYPLVPPYTVYRKSMNWQDAINHCESSESQLAVFINPGTVQNVVNNISRVSEKPTNSYIEGKMKVEFGRDRCYWIGLHTDHQLHGKWRWVNTSETLNYNTFWPEGHLDRTDKTENTQRCVALCNPNYASGKNHMFYHNSCLSKFYFICQAKPRTRITTNVVGGAKVGRSIGTQAEKQPALMPFKERSRRRYKKLHTTTEPPFSEEATTKSANDYENPFGSDEKVPTTTTTRTATPIMMIHPRALRKHPGFHKLYKQTTSEEVHLAKLKYKRIKTSTTTTTTTETSRPTMSNTKQKSHLEKMGKSDAEMAEETAAITTTELLPSIALDSTKPIEEPTLNQSASEGTQNKKSSLILPKAWRSIGHFGGRGTSGRGVASIQPMKKLDSSTDLLPSTTSDSISPTEETTLIQTASEGTQNKKSLPVLPKAWRSIGHFGGRGTSGRGVASIQPIRNLDSPIEFPPSTTLDSSDPTEETTMNQSASDEAKITKSSPVVPKGGRSIGHFGGRGISGRGIASSKPIRNRESSTEFLPSTTSDISNPTEETAINQSPSEEEKLTKSSPVMPKGGRSIGHVGGRGISGRGIVSFKETRSRESSTEFPPSATSDSSNPNEETTLHQSASEEAKITKSSPAMPKGGRSIGHFGGRGIIGRGIASYKPIRNRESSTEFPPSATSGSSNPNEETTLHQSTSEEAKITKSSPVVPKGGRSIGHFGGRGISGRGIASSKPIRNRESSTEFLPSTTSDISNPTEETAINQSPSEEEKLTKSSPVMPKGGRSIGHVGGRGISGRGIVSFKETRSRESSTEFPPSATSDSSNPNEETTLHQSASEEAKITKSSPAMPKGGRSIGHFGGRGIIGRGIASYKPIRNRESSTEFPPSATSGSSNPNEETTLHQSTSEEAKITKSSPTIPKGGRSIGHLGGRGISGRGIASFKSIRHQDSSIEFPPSTTLDSNNTTEKTPMNESTSEEAKITKSSPVVPKGGRSIGHFAGRGIASFQRISNRDSSKEFQLSTTSDSSKLTEETILNQSSSERTTIKKSFAVMPKGGRSIAHFGGRGISGRGVASLKQTRNRDTPIEFPPFTTLDSGDPTEETTLHQSASEEGKIKKSSPVMPKGRGSIGHFGGRGISGRGIALFRPTGNPDLSPTSENPENTSKNYVISEGNSLQVTEEDNSTQITAEDNFLNINAEDILDVNPSFASNKDESVSQNQAESIADFTGISSSSSRYGRSHKVESKLVGLTEKLSHKRKRKDPLLTIIRLAARLARIPAIKRRLEMTQSGEQDLEFVEEYLANVYASSTVNPSGVDGRSAPVGPIDKDIVTSLGVTSEGVINPAVKLRGRSSHVAKKLEPVQNKLSSLDSEVAQLPNSSGSRDTTTSTPSLIIEIETFTQPAIELPYVDAPATIQPTSELYGSSDNDATALPSTSEITTIETSIVPSLDIPSDALLDVETPNVPENSFPTAITLTSIESLASLGPDPLAPSNTASFLQPIESSGLNDNSVPSDSQFLNPKVLQNKFSLPLLPKNPYFRGLKSTRKKDPVLTIIKLALKLSALPSVKEMLDASESGEHDLSAIEQYLQILQMQKRMRLMSLGKASTLTSPTHTNVELNDREQMATPNNGASLLKSLHLKQELDAIGDTITGLSSELIDEPADIPNVDSIIETIETQLQRKGGLAESKKPTDQVGVNIHDLTQSVSSINKPIEEVGDDEIAPEDMFMEMIDNSNLVKRGVSQLNNAAAVMKIIKLTRNVLDGSKENPMENEV